MCLGVGDQRRGRIRGWEAHYHDQDMSDDPYAAISAVNEEMAEPEAVRYGIVCVGGWVGRWVCPL